MLVLRVAKLDIQVLGQTAIIETIPRLCRSAVVVVAVTFLTYTVKPRAAINMLIVRF